MGSCRACSTKTSGGGSVASSPALLASLTRVPYEPGGLRGVRLEVHVVLVVVRLARRHVGVGERTALGRHRPAVVRGVVVDLADGAGDELVRTRTSDVRIILERALRR